MTGTVAPGFEIVGATFDRELRRFGSGGGAFAAYVEGNLVADLWGGTAAPGQPWREDTLAVLMSATKGLVGLCAQILFDRGALDVDAPVAQYWPEFAQNGKAHILVRHVLTHTSGVLCFDGHEQLLHWNGRGFDDYETIVAGLAAARPCWPPGQRCGYHAMSYGWLMAELVRRITGTTVGNFFHNAVAAPLSLDAQIGTPPSTFPRVARVTDHLTSGLPLPLRLLSGHVTKQLGDARTLAGRAYFGAGGSSIIDHAEDLLNNPATLAIELPFGNGTATARSLARMYAMLTCAGELDGVRIVSPESVRAFATEVVRGPDALLSGLRPAVLGKLMRRPVRRTLGYLLNPSFAGQAARFGPSPAAFGHDGAGGQLGFCDLDRRVAVGFVRNELVSSPALSNRLISALYSCLSKETRHVPHAGAASVDATASGRADDHLRPPPAIVPRSGRPGRPARQRVAPPGRR